MVAAKNLDSTFNFSQLHSILLSHIVTCKNAIQLGMRAHTVVIPAFKRPRQKDGKSENKQDYTKWVCSQPELHQKTISQTQTLTECMAKRTTARFQFCFISFLCAFHEANQPLLVHSRFNESLVHRNRGNSHSRSFPKASSVRSFAGSS